MTTARKLTTPTADHLELSGRTIAVREAIASAAIEGGDVGDEARAIMQAWADGLIDKDTMVRRVLDLDERV